jgi:hypothetical protein
VSTQVWHTFFTIKQGGEYAKKQNSVPKRDELARLQQSLRHQRTVCSYPISLSLAQRLCLPKMRPWAFQQVKIEKPVSMLPMPLPGFIDQWDHFLINQFTPYYMVPCHLPDNSVKGWHIIFKSCQVSWCLCKYSLAD